MKKIICIALTLAMLLTTAAMADIPSYVNLESYYPLVNGEDVTLRVTIANEYLEADQNLYELYAWKFAQEFMGVKFELEQPGEERMAMLYASDDLPDIMFNAGLSTADMVNYGTVNGQLLDYAPYLSAELTPALTAFYERHPEAKAMCTTPSGSMYSFVYNDESSPDDKSVKGNFAYCILYINQAWLDELGLEDPDTLDELLNVFRAFKEKDPENIIPYASIPNQSHNLLDNMLGGYGIYTNTKPYQPAVTAEGEVIIPATTEAYKDYLTFMNTCFSEGLIAPDFFTMSATDVRALMAEGRIGCVSDWAPYLSVTTFDEWDFAGPFVRNEGDTPAIVNTVSNSVGGTAIAASTKYPEVCLRMIDWLFTPEGFMRFQCGPVATEDESMKLGFKGMTVNESGNLIYQDVLDGDADSDYAFRMTHLAGSGHNVGTWWGVYEYQYSLMGKKYPGFEWNLADGDQFYRWTKVNHTYDYLVDGFPSTIYLSEEDSETVADIGTALKEYVEAEEAKFIVGSRSLDEFDDFVKTLYDIGIEEYLAIYDEAYAPYRK